jgi:hypothetical protein
VRRGGFSGRPALPGGNDACLLLLTPRLLVAAAAAEGLAASAGISEQAYSGRREAAVPTVLHSEEDRS